MRHVNKLVIFMALLFIVLLLSACQAPAVSTDNAAAPADTGESQAAVAAEPADMSESEAEAPAAPADTAESETEATAEPADTGESEAEVTTETADMSESEAEATAEPADMAESEAEDSAAAQPARTLEENIASATSAGPAPIAQDAAILDYPEDWPGNWPDEPAPELIEIRTGSNGWTCIIDRPDTPGNDPMCLNDTYLEVFLSQFNLVDAPSTGVGFGYMLQGGGPVGSPPHMMVFVPESNSSFDAFGTEPGPFPWIMFPETSQQHLMVLMTPPAGAVTAADDKIANAMSAGPAPIAQDAAILDYPEDWPGNWPDEPAPELIEIREGSNGWTCIVDIPDTPGNDPMCLNDTYLEMLMAQRNLVEAPSTGVGFGYMLQGGGPVGSPPHMMVFVPESNGSFDVFGTEPGPFPWIMYPETPNQHLMVLAS